MYDVFISHSSRDKDTIVRELVTLLEKAQLEVWYDENCIYTGDKILESIEDGLEQSLCGVILISEFFLNSSWTWLEIGYILSKKAERVLIPVLHNISETELITKMPFLGNIKSVSTKDGLELVVDTIVKSVINLKTDLNSKNHTISFRDIIRKLNTINSPVTNDICITLQKYRDIRKIDSTSAVMCARKIVNQILRELSSNFTSSQSNQLSGINLLDIVKKESGLITKNIIEHFKLIYSYIEDIINTHTIQYEYPIQLIELSLDSILNWYIGINLKNITNTKSYNLEIVYPDKFKYSDFVDMYKIDQLVLREDLIATPNITYEWHKHNIYTHIGIRDKIANKVIGYFAVLPITDELYDEIIAGNFKDNDLPIDNIRQYDFPDFYKLYVACVCVHPDYQATTNAFVMLYNALIEIMLYLAKEREVYITDIITEASTPKGEQLCNVVGMKKLLNTNLETEIYGSTLLPPALRLRSKFGKELIQYYQRKYNEFREFF